jgi:periplasmic divalent cation tolerance protein
MDALVVQTTLGSAEAAEALAQTLVERQLAACVQIIGPLVSIYRWKDKLEKSAEWLCLIKSRRVVLDQLEAAIRELHPYEVPEILLLPADVGNHGYLRWLQESVPG